MATHLNPYLNFNNKASEAIDFYHSVFGGKVTKTAFKDGGMDYDPAEGDLVMHGQIVTDSGLWLMASDTPGEMNPEHQEPTNGTISLSGDNEDELKGYYEKLSAGGTVTLPLAKAPWGDWFGMCQDRFGINWMVNIAGNAVEA